jgi:hypothetical protein
VAPTTGWPEPSPCECAADDHANTVRGESDARREVAKEDTSTRAERPTISEVKRDRSPDIRKHRQALNIPPFPADNNFAAAPTEIPDLKGGDLAGAEAQAREEQEDGVVSTSACGRAITRVKEAFHLLRAEVRMYRRLSPPTYRRNGKREVYRSLPL